MKVNELTTQNFRNLEDFTFEADSKINVIFGNNAQGKTNLMEALWLFTGNRSFRGAKEADRKSTRLNSSHIPLSRMPSSA